MMILNKEIKASIDTEAKLIDFWDEHWYNIQNSDSSIQATYPSVTSVIDKILAKGFAFENFLRQTGLESRVITREAAESGSRIHNAIENLINGNSLSALDEKFTLNEWKKLNNWLNWYEELAIEPICTEKIVYDTTLEVAGTADFICRINGEVWLLDWKSGNNIYSASHLQVSAYAKFWNKLKNIPKIKHAGIVHIGATNKKKDGLNNTGVKVIEVDINQNFKTFKELKKLYDWQFPNEKAPTNIYPLELQLKGGVLSA